MTFSSLSQYQFSLNLLFRPSPSLLLMYCDRHLDHAVALIMEVGTGQMHNSLIKCDNRGWLARSGSGLWLQYRYLELSVDPLIGSFKEPLIPRCGLQMCFTVCTTCISVGHFACKLLKGFGMCLQGIMSSLGLDIQGVGDMSLQFTCMSNEYPFEYTTCMYTNWTFLL